jgi:hypothetical protein
LNRIREPPCSASLAHEALQKSASRDTEAREFLVLSFSVFRKKFFEKVLTEAAKKFLLKLFP